MFWRRGDLAKRIFFYLCKTVTKTYLAIDLKSFYASVECVERGLDALGTHLVVADPTRTEKTICLAVSPSLKAYGISGRARLFEVVQAVRKINDERLRRAPGRRFHGSSADAPALAADPGLRLDYIVAPPRMAHYMSTSAKIYSIYLRYIAPEDIHVYSVDEVFIDATEYLPMYGLSAHDLAMKLVREVLAETGITATAGIGTNLYLAKIAMDIEAKHSPPDKDGVRIAALDEMTYRQKYWNHLPLTDFWRVGKGTVARLASAGLLTMGDIARCSLGKPWERHNPEVLYRLFGVNAELVIDHAWGWEPCTMADIKAYRPEGSSLSSGQVLKEPYTFDKARIVIREMADTLVMDLLEKHLVTDQIVISVGYDTALPKGWNGDLTKDYYGRQAPKPAHGSANLGGHTSSLKMIADAVTGLFDRIVNPRLYVRRMYVVANHTIPEDRAGGIQLDLFEEAPDSAKEKSAQEAILAIRRKFGKNAILKGIDFEDGATTIERNQQIGGHKA